jgi:DNA-binding Lrp family transcriptional regulator
MPRPTSPSVTAADLDGRCTSLRASGLSYREIGRQLGISPANAHKRVTRALDRTRREPAAGLRELELERLDALQVALTTVLARRHVTISAGKVVLDTDGQPYLDDGPVVAAAQALVRVQESRRKLLGLDEPARADVTARIHAEVYSVDALDRELERVTAELAEQDPEWGEQERRRQDLDRRLVRFRGEWSTPGRVITDPAGFVGEALDLALQLLDMDDPAREQVAVEVERLLWDRAR